MAYGYITPYRRPYEGRSSGWGSNVLFDLNRQINRLFDDFFDSDDDDRSKSFASKRANSPLMDVSRTEQGYRIDAELPGVKKDDVEVMVEDGVLSISGEKKRSYENDDDSWNERSYGRFERRISLPTKVKSDDIEADFEDGVLKIFLPLSEKGERGRKVELGGRKSEDSRLIDDDSTKIEENA